MSTGGKKMWARAAWDFSTDRAREIPFLEGDLMEILDYSKADWWQARKADGSQGRIPAAYVQVLDPETVEGLAVGEEFAAAASAAAAKAPSPRNAPASPAAAAAAAPA
uniref:SH3 domain-containing protein n=1 Tax=Phaeomonas parva TaxID=124430 RepID=A0A7S1UDB1_9STRA|mmetsp:Transcript_4179/g.12171  ORF Transcript_4179/g.12171 Transcript_4179/m.12171 type:complete len:108 (+) Transcript_4179:383-706(+)